MPKVNVYLPERYAEIAKKYALPLSTFAQDAVLNALARQLPLLLLTPRARDILLQAEQQARVLGHHYIGVEHLLLAILVEGKSVASSVFRTLNIERTVQEELLRVMHTTEYTSRSHKAFDSDGNLIGYLESDQDTGQIRLVDEQGKPVAFPKARPKKEHPAEE